jgi:hypothetical protein
MVFAILVFRPEYQVGKRNCLVLYQVTPEQQTNLDFGHVREGR